MLTADQFTGLLLARQEAWVADNPPPDDLKPWARLMWQGTLADYVRPGDRELFEPPKPAVGRTSAPRLKRQKRGKARAELIAERDELQGAIERLNATAGTAEMAAATGEGMGRRANQKRWERLEREIIKAAPMIRRLNRLNALLEDR